MNILFFLIPKSQVAYVNADDTIRQVTEKMIHHNLTAVPILSSEGKYLNTAETTNIMVVSHERKVDAIRYDADINDLFDIAINQNFVPVTDDHGIFIGIITRRAILEHFRKLARKDEESDA